MQKADIDSELKECAFEYFYWFSRFEFALKENKYLKDKRAGAGAKSNWEEFRLKHQGNYVASNEARRLVDLHPKKQIVAENGGLEWRPVGFDHCDLESDLCRVITALQTVRNNLFHGGKHGDVDVDSKDRNVNLLTCSKIVLDQLAEMAGFLGDYTRHY